MTTPNASHGKILLPHFNLQWLEHLICPMLLTKQVSSQRSQKVGKQASNFRPYLLCGELPDPTVSMSSYKLPLKLTILH